MFAIEFNGVVRTLKKSRTSKGDYCTKQRFSTITSVFKAGTSLKGIVEEPGFKNVKNKHLGTSPF